MLRRFSLNFAIFSMLLDGLLVLGAMFSMSELRLNMNQLSFIADLPENIRYPIPLFFLFPLVWVVVLSGFSIYDGKKFFKIVDELSTLTVASLIAAIVQAGILYLSYRDFSRALFLMIILVSYLGCILWRLITRLIFRIRKETLNLSHRILIVGMGNELKKAAGQLEKDPSQSIEKIIQLDLRTNTGSLKEIPERCPSAITEIRKAVIEHKITDVIIAFPRNHADWIGAVTTHLEDLPLGVWVALDYYDLSLSDTRVESLAGLSLMDLRAPALDEYSRIIKRVFDIVVGTLAILLLSPLFLLLGLLIMVFDGFPVFFFQQRIGENGRPFKMIKFRTMVRDAEKMQRQVEHLDEQGNLIHKSPDDPRVTRLGRILRRFSLDELPQFFNVLKGDMSLVGPRPELPYLVDNYDHWQRRRLSVPPGITGWWQINGRADRIMHLHTEDDLYYIENFSIWLDIKILIRTVWTVIIGRGAF